MHWNLVTTELRWLLLFVVVVVGSGGAIFRRWLPEDDTRDTTIHC